MPDVKQSKYYKTIHNFSDQKAKRRKARLDALSEAYETINKIKSEDDTDFLDGDQLTKMFDSLKKDIPDSINLTNSSSWSDLLNTKETKISNLKEDIKKDKILIIAFRKAIGNLVFESDLTTQELYDLLISKLQENSFMMQTNHSIIKFLRDFEIDDEDLES